MPANLPQPGHEALTSGPECGSSASTVKLSGRLPAAGSADCHQQPQRRSDHQERRNAENTTTDGRERRRDDHDNPNRQRVGRIGRLPLRWCDVGGDQGLKGRPHGPLPRADEDGTHHRHHEQSRCHIADAGPTTRREQQCPDHRSRPEEAHRAGR